VNFDVAVVATGTANTASILAGLRRAGARARLTDRARDVADAARVVLPGVGAFAAARARLDAAGLTEPLRERIAAGRPTLAVCLGLQLLAEASEESPDARGLAVIPGTVRRFDAGLTVPHMGWNQVELAPTSSQAQPGCERGSVSPFTAGATDAPRLLLEPGHAYFANSYRLETPPAGWAWAATDYGGRFVAAIERAGVLACKFHPELSGAWGRALLERWVHTCEEAACSPFA
jgi:imidazoleglycerol phosphate synthase glutamine amidotransferase subunit HisH